MGGYGSGGGGKKTIEYKPVKGREVFERQPYESDVAWEAFKTYRDFGLKRSQAKVALKLGKSVQIIYRWSRRWGWRLRVEAWDMESDRCARQAELTEIAEMRKRQIQMAKGLQGLGARELRKRIQASEKTEIPVLTPDQLVRSMSEGFKLERVCRGEPSDIVEEQANPGMTIEQIESRIEQLLKSRKK